MLTNKYADTLVDKYLLKMCVCVNYVEFLGSAYFLFGQNLSSMELKTQYELKEFKCSVR